MEKQENVRKKLKKWTYTIMFTAVLLSGLSVSALAEEPEIRTFQKAGVRFTIPEEFKNLKGFLSYWEDSDSYTPPTYSVPFDYTAMPEEEYNASWKKMESGELSEEEHTIILTSTVATLGIYWAVKGDLTDIPAITKDDEVIELGLVDGFNRYYVKEFVPDKHSDWDEEYLKEAEMLSDIIVDMLKQAEHFKPVDPAAELIGKKLNFKAEDLDHVWHTSEELFFRNRFTLVNVWGTWCGACKQELEDLGKFHRQIEEKNCGVLGIEHEHKAYEKFVQDAKDILKEKNVTYPNVLINDDMDLNDKIPGHPTFFFVNSEGVVVSPIYMGTKPVFDIFTPVLDQLLAEADSVNSGFKSTDLDGNTVTSEELNGTVIPKTEDQETGSYRYRVFVEDEEGNSLEEVAVQFCDADACRVGETDEQGCAVFEVSEEKSYEIHILDVPDGFEDLEETFNTDVKASDTTIVLKKQ